MILYVPDCHKNHHDDNYTGYGHLVRCIKIAALLGGDILLEESMHAFAQTLLYDYQQLIMPHLNQQNQHKKVSIISEPNACYKSIIIDKRIVQKEDVQWFSSYGMVICIDAGGVGRAYAHYTIDTLPNIMNTAPNTYICGGGVDPFLERKQQWSGACKRILFYTDGVYKAKEIAFLESILQYHGISITLITSDTSAYIPIAKKYANFTVRVFHIEYITKHIQDYDVYITHFGISAYESIVAKVPVILLNKSAYHHALSKKAGFPHCFSYIPDANISNGYNSLSTYIKNIINDELSYADLIVATKTIGEYDHIVQQTHFVGHSIKNIIKHYNIAGDPIPTNPWKGIALEKAVYRDEEKTIFFCEDTRQWHQLSFSKHIPRYNDDYFFEAYKRQYGRTYIEDFSTILQTMRLRMKYIQKFLSPSLRAKYSHTTNIHTKKKYVVYHKNKNNPIACDIGAAYGAMVQASSEYGYASLGIEINKKAVMYASKIVQGRMIVGNIEEQKLSDLIQTNGNAVVIISAFFFIEHIKNLEYFLDDIKQVLEKGGVIAFSVPNGAGISAKNNRVTFFQESPFDHFSIFTPHGLRMILKKAGFTIKKIHITGHHPERFRVPRFLRGLALLWSTLFGLGDTFEIYAVKEW